MKKCLWCNDEIPENSTFTRGSETYYDKFCSNKCRSGYSKEYGEPKYTKPTSLLTIISCIVIFYIIAKIFGH